LISIIVGVEKQFSVNTKVGSNQSAQKRLKQFLLPKIVIAYRICILLILYNINLFDFRLNPCTTLLKWLLIESAIRYFILLWALRKSFNTTLSFARINEFGF
jgi:hypothetical protein